MILPVSGRKLLAGSSVVIRHCSAAPRSRIESCDEAEVGERLAGGDPHLRLHEVDVGDLLGHGVLDLDARVHLDEDVVAVAGRAGTRRCRRCGSRSPSAKRTASAHIRSRSSGSRLGAGAISTTFWCRRCTEQSRSKRWITLPSPSARICTSMWRGLDHGLLDEHGRVAERALALAHAGLDRLAQVLRVVDPAHAAAATAGDGLDEERVRAARRRPRRARRRRSTGSTRRQGRYAGRLGRRDRARLVAGQGRARRRSGRRR